MGCRITPSLADARVRLATLTRARLSRAVSFGSPSDGGRPFAHLGYFDREASTIIQIIPAMLRSSPTLTNSHVMAVPPFCAEGMTGLTSELSKAHAIDAWNIQSDPV